MNDVIEALCRRFARRIRTNGELMLTHDGDPALVRAFAALGWGDAHPEVEAPPAAAPAEATSTTTTAATVRDGERAVMPAAKGHTA